MTKRQSRTTKDLIHKAKSGDAKAAFQLYEDYRDGSFVEKDSVKADEYAGIALNLFRTQSLHVTDLKLVAFRSFKSTELSFCHHSNDNGNLTVLVGVNGAGKTTVLDSIAKSLSWLILRILRPAGNGKGLTPSEYDIHSDSSGISEYASVVLGLGITSKLKYGMELSKAKGLSKGQRNSDVEDIGRLGRLYKLANVKDPNFNMPIMAYYGVDRTIEFGKKDINKIIGDMGDRQDKFDGYDKALNVQMDFVGFFKWFKYQNDIAKQEKDDAQEKASRSLDWVSEVIKSAMPGFKNLRAQLIPSIEWLIDKNDLTLNVNQLSQGEKSLLALVLDIARRLILLNPDTSKCSPLDGHGFVLVDEIDLHLHPAWQQQVVPSLLNTFPNLQFILTTHSPQVLSTVRREQIRLLGKNQDGEVVITIPSVHTYGEPSSEIMQSLMSVDPQPPVPEKPYLERLTALVDQGFYDSDEAGKLFENLKASLNPRHPQLEKIERSIRRQKALGK